LATGGIITESEILDALALAAQERGEGAKDARTAKELCEATGKSQLAVRQALQRLKKEGRLVVHWVPRELLDGRVRAIVAYTILPAKKKK
jgi:DNA-binding transcriptional regulator PaaX